MAASATSAALTPSRLNDCSRCFRPPTSKHRPMMPFRMIITAANTVSRANAAASAPPAIIKETMSATSISVTASASTSVPYGSPTRCATTSAWCTAANTLPVRLSAMMATNGPLAPKSKPPPPSQSPAMSGATMVHNGSSAGHRLVRVSVAMESVILCGVLPRVTYNLSGNIVEV